MRQVELQATILDTATTSSALEIKGSMLAGILTDAGFDGASLTAEVSFDGGTTWTAVSDDAGAAVTVTVAASSFARLRPIEWAFAEMIRFVSSAPQAGANSVLTVIALAD